MGWGALAAALYGLSTPDGGAAEGDSRVPVELGWDAPAHCPAAQDVLRRARALLDEPEASVAEGTTDRVRVDARVRAHGAEGWRLQLAVETSSGTSRRSTVEASCDVLADITAVVVAVAVDPSLALDLAPPARAEDDRPVAPSKPAPAPRRPPSPPPAMNPADPRVRGLVRFAAGVAGGALPTVSAVLSLAVGVTRPWWRVEAFGLVHVPREYRPRGLADAGGRFGAWLAGVRGCPTPSLGPVRFPICAGGSLGVVHAAGVGVQNPRHDRQLWAALHLGSGVSWRFAPRFAISARADMVVPVYRPGFHLDDAGVVYRVGRVAARCLGGLEVHFP